MTTRGGGGGGAVVGAEEEEEVGLLMKLPEDGDAVRAETVESVRTIVDLLFGSFVVAAFVVVVVVVGSFSFLGPEYKD